MERTPEVIISEAVIIHELAESKLTPEERKLLERLDNSSTIYENNTGRQMNGEQWIELINSIPGVEEALDKYSNLMNFYEKKFEDKSLRVN